MRFRLRSVFWVLFVLIVLQSTGMSSVTAGEQPEYRVSAGKVFADFKGGTYEITASDWPDLYPYKEITAIADLDADGLLDAVVSLGTGGNCCRTDYAVVTYRGGGFFAIATHPDFASWFPPEIVTTPRELILSIRMAADGVGNTSLEETIVMFRLENGQLTEISKLQNAAMLFSENTLSSKTLVESGKEHLSLIAMLDGDKIADEIICKYWERWGALSCTVKSSRFGRIKIHMGCDRIGVLKSQSNGLKDLVCERDVRLLFDGQDYSVLQK